MDAWAIAAIAAGIIAAFAAGKLQILAKEVKELFAVIEVALEDKRITKEELAQIVKEAEDVKDAAVEIAYLVSRRK